MAIYRPEPGGYRDLGLVRQGIKTNKEIHRMLLLQLDEHPTPRYRQLASAALILLIHQVDWLNRMVVEPGLSAREPLRVNRLLVRISLMLLDARPTPRGLVYLNSMVIEQRKQMDALLELHTIRGGEHE